MATLISLPEAKGAIGNLSAKLSGEDEAWFNAALEAVTDVIERETGPILMRPVELTVPVTRTGFLLPWPVHSLNSVTAADGTVLPAERYIVHHAEGIIELVGGYYGGTVVTVNALVGMEKVPPSVALAARELIRFWWQQGRQGGGPFASSDQGDFTVPQGYLMPNRVMSLLAASQRRLPGFA